MPTDDLAGQVERMRSLYAASVAAHGAAPRGAGWKDAATQRLRFDVLSGIIDPARPYTVNDLGCGYGALFSYLADERRTRPQRYYGYDVSPEMLDEARGRLHDDAVELIESPTVTRDADYTIVCGTLFNKLGASDDAWAAYVRDTLSTAASRSRRGLAFNLNSVHVDWRDDELYYADPLEYFEFCRVSISRLVALRHDYSRFEWSMLVTMEST
jgi:SAM-dependent methyltransferase